MKSIFSLILALVLAGSVSAQIETEVTKTDDSTKKKGKKSIAISTSGIHFSDEDKKDTVEKKFNLHYGIVDLGINYLQDQTDYASPGAQQFLSVDQNMKNENLFSLREGKSINVNVIPVTLRYTAVKTKGQRIYLSLGAGLQMYNFRFNKSISYVNETKPMVIMDSIGFSKNKLGITYLTVPLSVIGKTRLAKDVWLVYGVSVSGGYRIASWMKQVSDERGKDKNHDRFNLNNFNSCVTAEFGIDGIFRLYASYQVTALHEDGLDQHPYSIGFRFGGI
jgi:hypothetical protein